MYRNVELARGKYLSDFKRGFIVWTRVERASVAKTALLARASMGTATKVTSAFRSIGKTSSIGSEIVVDGAHLMTVTPVH